MLVALASMLFVLETLIPLPLPWIRLGLANIVLLLALKWWGMKEAIIILCMRVILGSLLSGKFLHPVFIMAVGGGLGATFIMGLCMPFENRILSLIGISVIGALTKNIIQLFIAYLLYIRQLSIFLLSPIFLTSSLITGLIIGICAYLIERRVNTDTLIFH